MIPGGLGATDWIDGYLARRLGQTSEFGKKFDPTVDRILFVVALVSIIAVDGIPVWFAVLALVREVGVGLVTLILFALRYEPVDVVYIGKVGTFALLTAIPLFLASTGISTDTRKALPGGLFFALSGPSFNANTFAAKALDQGCTHAVVDDPAVAMDDRYLLVPDSLQALQQLACHHRRSFDIPVVAITGTNGKTTTKELLHAVLSADRSTLATEGNLNNHIGVPLTLLKLKPAHRIAIIVAA